MKLYKVMVKSKRKWTSSLELITKDDIIWSSGVNESRPFHVHVKFYLKAVSKCKKRKCKLMEQKWEEYKL